MSDELVHVGGEHIQYCPRCGAPLVVRLIETEDRPRLICDRGHIHYINPVLVVGVIPERDGRTLLMRRAIEPRLGAWAFPGGFMEIDETVEEAAAREVMEEVGVQVEIENIIGVYSRPGPAPGPGIVSLVFRGLSASGDAQPGREALEARWFTPEEIPWDELAYETTHWALKDWVAFAKEHK
ncbi:MAG TPA: NUDIX hydrolase [Dehalococcoidia bacterium]|nr:NUDIX hydrolase [Dehalococcoidia bacterium]